MADEPHFIDGIGSMLALLGINPSEVHLNYEDKVLMAMPESKVILYTEGDEIEDFKNDEWYLVRLDVNLLKAIATGYSVLSSMAVEHMTRLSAAEMLKSGSSEEQKLLSAILRANIRMPNRNFKFTRPDGTELTVPDFAWEDLKLAFFVDGLWWHVAKDDAETLKQIAKSRKNSAELVRQNKNRDERDKANRTELQLRGWTVLACTDRDLATDAGVKKQVDNILRAMRMLQKRKNSGELDAGISIGDIEPDVTEDVAEIAEEPKVVIPVQQNPLKDRPVKEPVVSDANSSHIDLREEPPITSDESGLFDAGEDDLLADFDENDDPEPSPEVEELDEDFEHLIDFDDEPDVDQKISTEDSLPAPGPPQDSAPSAAPPAPAGSDDFNPLDFFDEDDD